MQRDMNSRPEFDRLCDFATGRISWQEYQGEAVPKGFITGMLLHIIDQADILCTTPSLSCGLPYRPWKERARGIAVDEAGNISRPDFYSAWGNTLLPCLISGDEKQLRPHVTTAYDPDPNDAINRFAQDALISPLEFFTASGWPIYRLRVQLRMARGLFDTCHRETYSDLPFTYGLRSNLRDHSIGVELETYLTGRFPGLIPSRVGAKKNPDQVDNALDLLCDFVRIRGIDASRLAIITPYRANVKLIAGRRKAAAARYALLSAMRPAETVDSSQSCEADIVVAILGTTEAVGPGFTTDEHRFNVMLSRQKSGLLIFGDINVLGSGAPGEGNSTYVSAGVGAEHVSSKKQMNVESYYPFQHSILFPKHNKDVSVSNLSITSFCVFFTPTKRIPKFTFSSLYYSAEALDYKLLVNIRAHGNLQRLASEIFYDIKMTAVHSQETIHPPSMKYLKEHLEKVLGRQKEGETGLRRALQTAPRKPITAAFDIPGAVLRVKQWPTEWQRRVRDLTVDKAQGNQADVVFLDMVRTTSVGFMDDPQRLDVAITQAGQAEIIVMHIRMNYRQAK
ncbi:hypothetical protein A0O28_0007050 [Trichoderma guizhouense]|uniref:DNA2/NAM7 helicase-like C-terminal domain-containing protein n=1 Tax=Trichoderma guizhouense TaxID=1491466 RepID=A0A1T3CI19_9HYPO|nr:hypothetical protein A0O28_0007050 [Trichoderma guizhouense]